MATVRQLSRRLSGVVFYWPARLMLRLPYRFTSRIRLRLHAVVLYGEFWWSNGRSDEWLWKWLGFPLAALPESTILGGIRHRIQVSDGLVVFSQKDGMYGTHSRICFERDGDGMLWYLKFSETWDRAPMCHVLQAFEMVKAVYGGDFQIKKPAIRVKTDDPTTAPNNRG